MAKTTSDTQTYPDIPRPGDADFRSFPKVIAEDAVQYSLHIIPTISTTSASIIRNRLLRIQKASVELTKKLLTDYIWQREAFSLQISTGETSSRTLPYLYGQTSFGDSIADEWLIVYLLLELSKQFEDAWIRVHDADGEFLLVEAANVLPKWLNPEIAEHRVWIHRGQLRIIPRQLKDQRDGNKAKAIPKELSLQQALAFVADFPNSLVHSPIVEEEAFYRLRNYPAQIEESLHTARLTVPRTLAHILHQTPSHVSPAIEAFYLRDPISLRPLQHLSSTDSILRFPPKDFVTTSIRFTRVGYAQLQSQDFPPPPAWRKTWSRTKDAALHTRRMMGMKLACGFEMLLADPQNRDKRSVREINLLLEDVENGEDALPTDVEISKWPQEADDERWMDVNFEDFERELGGTRDAASNDKAGKKAKGDFGFGGDKGAQDNLRRMVEKFEQFLNDDNGAGVDGVEGDEMDEEEEDDTDEAETGEDSEVFDEEAFEKLIKKQMMGLSLDDDDDSGEYSKPAEAGRIVELDDDDSDEAPTSAERIVEIDDDDEHEIDEDDEEDLEKVMARIEAELKESGALDLETNLRDALLKGGDGDSDEEETELDDEQYRLAKNLLEAFKGQAGMAGPAGNMLGSMGIRLPRDERDEDVD